MKTKQRTQVKARYVTKAVAAMALALAGTSSWALQYSLTELPALAGFSNTYATGLNNSGQVIGLGYNGGVTEMSGIPYRYADIGGGKAFVTGANGAGISAIEPLAGHHWSRAAAINDAGQVAGYSGGGGANFGNPQAFVTNASTGVASALTGLGGRVSEATAINASGQVAGYYKGEDGASHVYLSAADGSTVKTLGVAGVYVDVSTVTDDGRVLGRTGDVGNYGPGFITGPQGDAPQILPTIQLSGYSNGLMPIGINDAGQIGGHYVYPYGRVFVRDADGTERVLDFSTAPFYDPGGLGGFGQYGPRTSVKARGIGQDGQVVGIISSNGLDVGASRAFITGPDGAGVVQLDQLSFANVTGPLGFYFTSATGINDLGHFVANGSNGKSYLISVVPEPSSYALMLSGLALMGLAMRWRRG